MNIKKFLDSLKPRCTIYLNWTGPSCKKPAISRNKWGGFQCEWHSSDPRPKQDGQGPYLRIQGDSLLTKIQLQSAYLIYLCQDFFKKKPLRTKTKMCIDSKNVPNNMKRRN